MVAAEQRIGLVDTAFTGDLPGATSAIFQAGAGNSGWGGVVDYEGIRVTGKRPASIRCSNCKRTFEVTNL